MVMDALVRARLLGLQLLTVQLVEQARTGWNAAGAARR
jgi:hypothetical protein